MNVVYRCTFWNEKEGCIMTTDAECLADFMTGFWVDKQFEFCKTSEVFYWIPPNQIKLVEKIKS